MRVLYRFRSASQDINLGTPSDFRGLGWRVELSTNGLGNVEQGPRLNCVNHSRLGYRRLSRVKSSYWDPSKVENFKVGYSGSGLAVDSLGNVWIMNKLGSSERGHAKLLEVLAAGKINYNGDPDALERMGKVLVPALTSHRGRDTIRAAASRSYAPMVARRRFHPSLAKGSPLRGRYRWMATTTSGSRTSPLRQTESWSYVDSARKIPRGLKTGDAISEGCLARISRSVINSRGRARSGRVLQQGQAGQNAADRATASAIIESALDLRPKKATGKHSRVKR